LALLAETASPGPFTSVTHSPVDPLDRGSPSRCSLSGSALVAVCRLFRPGVTRGVARAAAGKPVIGRGKQPRRRDSGSRPDAAPLADGGPFPSIRPLSPPLGQNPTGGEAASRKYRSFADGLATRQIDPLLVGPGVEGLRQHGIEKRRTHRRRSRVNMVPCGGLRHAPRAKVCR
jgi:hypothetical protein